MGETPRIRLATSSDLVDLAVLEAACFHPAWTIEQIGAELRSSLSTILVAEDASGRPIASATTRQVADEAELLRIAVLPELQRRGYGQALVSEVVSRLAERGVVVCHLEVSADNGSARRLYAQAGFAVTGRRSAYYPDGSDAELMSLLVPRP